MKKLVLAIMITAGSIGSAQAWGQREQELILETHDHRVL